MCRPLVRPGPLVRSGERVEVIRGRLWVVDPFPQCRPAVDHVDGELAELIFVREIAPEVVVRVDAADRLEGERLQPPGPEGVMIVGRALGMDEDASTQSADMLVKGWLEPDVAKRA